jgi:hypothetical protein
MRKPMTEPESPHADTEGWPELTYGYVMHYFWEPQHLTHTVASKARAKLRKLKRREAVDELLRSQEVPLNYLLNILLRIGTASLRRTCLAPFGIDLSADAGLTSLTLKKPVATPTIQPDVQLESESSRVFIELKVDAPLTREQIEKYVARHIELDMAPAIAKRRYLLLLVKKDPLVLSSASWPSEKISLNAVGTRLAALWPDSDVTFGAATWPAFGQALAIELDRRKADGGEAAETFTALIGDFLADLNSRGLVPAR